MTDPIRPDINDDISRYLHLDEKRQTIADEMDAIKARLRDTLDLGSYPGPGDVTVTLTPNRRFSADRAAELLPDDLLDACRVTTVDAKQAKAVLPPAAYDACMTEVGAPRLAIR